LTTSLCFTGEQIAERTHLICSFPELAFDVVLPAITFLKKPSAISCQLSVLNIQPIAPKASLKADG
jgi:hypothetical protein